MRVLERDRGVHEVFRRAGADANEAMQLAEIQLRKLPKAPGQVAYVGPRMLDLLSRAERESQRDKAESVGVEHLLHALAQEIRGKADAEASDIYAAAYNRDPEFYRFLKSMGTLEKSFDSDTLLLLSTDSELLRYLNAAR